MRILTTAVAIVACFLSSCGRNEGPQKNDGPPAKFYAGIYPDIRETSHSGMSEELNPIVRDRLACYENTFAFGDRLADCQSKYLLDIVLLARKQIESPPLLGECILSLKLCPIAYSMCKGELANPGEEECVHREVQAIEYVLDHYWRGKQPAPRTY